MENSVVIHTDGACKGNPGPGGWAAILSYGAARRELSGGEARTTNNRMEMTAVIRALGELKRPGCRVQVITDSQYVQRGMEEWLPAWRAKNYRKKDGKPVLNDDLWRALDELAAQHAVEWRWVRGHDGNEENERADQLASEQAQEFARRGR